jgi:hypothetical protein
VPGTDPQSEEVNILARHGLVAPEFKEDTRMGQRHGLGALILVGAASGLIAGCGKGENSSPNGASPATPIQMSIPSSPPDQAVVLGSDNIQAEIEKAGTGVKLTRLDLLLGDIPLTMDAPEGAKATNGPLDVQVTAGDHFALRIVLGRKHLDRKKQTLTGQKVLLNEKDLILSDSTLLLTARCEFARRLVTGHRDFCVENLDNVDGRLVNHSQADCLLMLKCAGTLAPKTPPPTDAAEALRQMKADLAKGADGRVTGLRLDPHHTTDATLALLAKIPDLEWLDLHRCLITDAGLDHLAGLIGLKELNLSDCEFTDAGLSSLGRLTNLELLNLASSFGDSPRIAGPGLAALAGMTRLQVLILDKNLVDDAALVHLKTLKGLKELHLEQTRVAGPGLANLKELPALTLLSLNETRVTDAGLEGLQGLSGLEVLNLRGTLVRGEGFKHLRGLTKLHSLILGSTPITDVELTNLTGLTGLRRLVLAGTEVTDAGLERLHGMKGLKQVALAGSKVTKEGIDKLKAALPGAEVTD